MSAPFVPLDDRVDILSGFAFPSTHFSAERGVPLIRIRDLGTSETVARYQGAYDERYLVSAGDILVGMDGDFRVVRWSGEPGLLNQRVCKVSARNGIDQSFLFHAIRQPLLEIQRRTASTTVKHLSARDVRQIRVLNVDQAEQAEIGGTLDAIDEAIEKTEAVIAATEDLRKALLQELLTRGVPGWHTEWKTVPGIGTVPACWEVARGESIVKLGGGYAPADFAFDEGGDVLFVKVDDLNAPGATRYVTDSALKWSTAAHARVKPVPPPFIVLPKRGAAIFQNKVAIVRQPAVVDPNLMTVHPLAGVSIEFLRYLFSHTQLPRLADNSGVPQLNNKHIYPHDFALPSCREQQAIASVLISLEDVVKQERAVLSQAVHAKSIAAEALLTGRVRVAVDKEVGRG